MSDDKLQLKDTMEYSHLIQRLGPPGPSIMAQTALSSKVEKILEQAFSFDYMGASEFEFGSIPTAIIFIREEAMKNDLVCGEFEGIYYICPKSYEDGVKKVISQLLLDENSMRLKEYCGLKEAKKGLEPDTLGWLELNNGFFFFVDRKMFENTKEIFRIK